MKRVIAVTAAAAVALLLASCSEPGNGGDQSEDAVTTIQYIASSSPPSVGQATYTSLPQALGFWEDGGVAIEMNVLEGSAAAVQGIDAGQGEVSPVGASAMITGAAANPDINAVAFYTYTTSGYQQPAVPADSDIQTLADLAGKSIGVQNLESGSIPVITAMLREEGVDMDTVTFLPVGTGPEALAALQNGQVDALGLWDDRHAEIENLGVDLRILSNDFADGLGFQGVIIANREWLDENRDAAIAFGRGVAMATVFALENPEAAVRLHWEVFPESKPTNISEEEALARGVNTLTARLENSKPVDDLFGQSREDQVGTFIDVLLQAGTIASVSDKPSVGLVWDGSMVEDFNDFDADAIRELAREYE
jgi:NitT/TauT family transport system substrate-binding protein